MSRSDLAFLSFFALYTAVSLLLLLMGLGPPLAKAVPGVAESFEAWGGGEDRLSALWRGMVEAGHFSEGSARLALDYAFSALNIGLGLFLVWQRPRGQDRASARACAGGDGCCFQLCLPPSR